MDATKKPLTVPPEFGLYAEKNDLFDLLKFMLEQVIINKPEDPLKFLIDLLKKDNKDVPRVLVLGPPLSGKRSASKLISEKLNAMHLNRENLLKDVSAPLRRQLDLYAKNGYKDVPDQLWGEIIKERIAIFDCQKKGWVLEGFPNTRQLARWLQQEGVIPNHVAILDADDSVLLDRAEGKRVDPVTGESYHTAFDWPSSPEIANRLQAPQDMSERDLIPRLMEYRRNIEGIKDCYKNILKVIAADQPKSDVVLQAISYLHIRSRVGAPHTPRIVLVGPTGSGKALQAGLLAKKYKLINVSCELLLKEAIADGTKLGKSVDHYLQGNMPVPDSLMLQVIKNRLNKMDCTTRGWVLRGFPRTREQAEMLENAQYPPNRIIFLDITVDSIMERVCLRRVDPISGDSFHLQYKPPIREDVRDRLQQQPKDTPDKVQQKVEEHYAYVDSLMKYYEGRSKRVNADQDQHTVFEEVESFVVNPLPQKIE